MPDDASSSFRIPIVALNCGHFVTLTYAKIFELFIKKCSVLVSYNLFTVVLCMFYVEVTVMENFGIFGYFDRYL